MEGNPGAASAIADLMKKEAKGELSFNVPAKMVLLDFDMHQIYGSDIWRLYKDCCNGDINQVNLIFRHYNIGLLTHEEITQHLPTNGRGIPFSELLTPEEIDEKLMKLVREQVAEHLPAAIIANILGAAMSDPKFKEVLKESLQELKEEIIKEKKRRGE